MNAPILKCIACVLLICRCCNAAAGTEKAEKSTEAKKGRVLSVRCQHVGPHLFQATAEDEHSAGIRDRIIVTVANLSSWVQSVAPIGPNATRVQQSLNKFHVVPVLQGVRIRGVHPETI